MDINFQLNFEKRTIVAYTNDVRDTIAEHVITRFPELSWLDVLRLLKKKNIPDSLVGKARCSPEDEFDETVGYRIAEYRLKQRFARAITRAYSILAENEYKRSSRLMDIAVKYAHSIDDDDKYVTQ